MSDRQCAGAKRQAWRERSATEAGKSRGWLGALFPAVEHGRRSRSGGGTLLGRGRLRGASLAELLIASTLFLMLSVALFQVMHTGSAFMRRSEASLDMQKELLLALTWIHKDMSESAARVFRKDPQGIVFASPRDLDGQLQLDSVGRITWQRIVAYYVDDVAGVPCLIRKERALTATSSDPILPPVTDMISDGSLHPRVLARSVQAFEGADTAAADTPYAITVYCAKEVGGREFGTRAQTSVFFRN